MRRYQAGRLALAAAFVLGTTPAVLAQTTAADTPKTFLGELTWFGYVENSATFNLRGKVTAGTNELRLYDVDRGYTFNVAELSVKNLLLTGGRQCSTSSTSA